MKQKNPFSRIIAGAMSWGSWGKQLSEKEMIALMHYCMEQGITTFDHADIYGSYTTEGDFGKAFAKSGIVRSEVQFISKCGIQYVCESRDNKIKHYNYEGDYITWSVERSLRELKTEYLDLLLLHRPSPLMEPGVIAEVVSKLKKQGKILNFGVSNFTPSQTELIRSATPVTANQIEFSLTHYEPMLNGSLDHMMQHGLIPMAWSPLGEVFKTETEQTARVKTLLSGLVEKYGASTDRLLLAWVLRHPAGVHPVIGTTNRERIRGAVEAQYMELSLEDWFAMWTERMGHKVP